MASARGCEVEGDTCKKEARALCYHCSKNLCLVHLTQHTQLIEEKTRNEIHLLADRFNEISSRFDRLSISEDVLENPLAQLNEWSAEAHAKIDQIEMDKRLEMIAELEKYRTNFVTNNKEQLLKLNSSKEMIGQLIQEGDASSKQLTDLQDSIAAAEDYLNTLKVPVVNLRTQTPIWSVHICSSVSDGQTTEVNKLREFKITYVRLSGTIRNYYIKTNSNGTMSDLMACFVRYHTLVEEATQAETTSAYTIEHLPKSDFILPVKVYNHRTYLQYEDTTQLNKISEQDMVVFYETAHSLKEEDNPCILMPCVFQQNSDKQGFGLPVYLNVPREGCRGQDVFDALSEALRKFFPSVDDNAQQLSGAYLHSTENSKLTETKLVDALDDVFDFNRRHVTLIVRFDDEIVRRYKQKYSDPLTM